MLFISTSSLHCGEACCCQQGKPVHVSIRWLHGLKVTYIPRPTSSISLQRIYYAPLFAGHYSFLASVAFIVYRLIETAPLLLWIFKYNSKTFDIIELCKSIRSWIEYPAVCFNIREFRIFALLLFTISLSFSQIRYSQGTVCWRRYFP